LSRKGHKEHKKKVAKNHEPVPSLDEDLAHKVIGAATEVHR
jgi:hypothetical protein